MMLAGAATIAVIMGQIFRYPSGVRDVLMNGFDPLVTLDFPRSYALLAPFFHAADHITILSLNQHITLILVLNALWILRRAYLFKRTPQPEVVGEVLGFLGFNVAVAVMIAAVVFVPRPMARLKVMDPEALVFDPHSHTSFSWDANKSFTPAKNLLWHKSAGFGAAFITDHNVVDGYAQARQFYSRDLPTDLTAPLPGEELSLKGCHLAVLGNRALIRNTPYDGFVEGIEKFLTVMKSSQALVIASLPEYWKYHWDRRDDFVKWGARGFEIVNSAPLSLDFPPSKRAEMIAFCRKNGLIMTGVTDTHGWGSTAYVWNVVKVPGWKSMSLDKLQASVLARLRKEKDSANRVFVRVKAEPRDNKAWLLIDPFLQVWEACRSMPASHAASSLAWIWAFGLGSALLRRKGSK